MLFNPINKKENAMIDYLINIEYDSSRPMGNVALSNITMLVGNWMVGLKEQTEVILPSRIKWIQHAIEKGESFEGEYENKSFHTCNLYKHLALAKWLHTNTDAVSDWEMARKIFKDNYDEGSNSWYPKNQLKTKALDDYLALCIQAGNYQAGIDEFEKYHGQKTISLKRKALTPREYGYLVCLNQIKPELENDTMLEVGRKMLINNLEDHPWLGYGQFSTAAMWLKIVYWHHDEELTPEQILLKCYENMPNVPKPDFIS